MTGPEFSRPIALDQIRGRGKRFDFAAAPEECRALAERMNLPAVTQCRVTGIVRGEAGGKLFRLEARLRAELLQTCVVTLDPLVVLIDETFARLYSRDPPDPAVEVVIDLDQEDPPDPLTEGWIDPGEAAAEQLALALDPFPRRPDAQFSLPEFAPETPNPFAVLAEVRKKR